jgi:hypothetical protein
MQEEKNKQFTENETNLFSEAINDRRSVMRHLWHTKKVYIHYLISAPKKLKSAGDKEASNSGCVMYTRP